MSTRVTVFLIITLVCLACAAAPLQAQVHGNPPNRVFEIKSVQHDVSGRLDQMVGYHVPSRQRPFLSPTEPIPSPTSQLDPVLQTSTSPAQLTSSGSGFDGVGEGFNGYNVQVAPPDPNLAVSANYIVQWVNTSLAIFDRTQNNALVLFEAGNTIWSGVGGPCETTNDGDPIVQYDRRDDVWVFTQLANTQGPTYYQCFAVSTSNDPRGPYNRYAWTFSSLNDYPKLGVWSDAFYGSYNMFLPFFGMYLFQGALVCGYDKNAMIQGASSATAQCSQLSASYASLLPADIDGPNLPPAGTPGLFVNYGSNSLNLWKLHVDFSNVNNATITGPINIPVASFSPACSGKTCIPQPGTTQQLDSLADRLMYRLAYRNFIDHDALVVNHSVVAGTSSGIRWYEIRTPATSPTVYQQGTFAPDSNYRWMGSMAMDQAGDIAVGYSLSNGSNIYPSIAYTGRLATDALGTMEAETVMFYGSGSQAGTNALSRWGDYTALRIDPADDCTFWYTNEYLQTTGTFNWSTRIGSFSFPSCASPNPDFSLSATPSSQTVTQGNGASYSISYTALNGYSGTVALTASGLPSGVGATFNPTSITAGTNSTMSVTTASSMPTGTYTLTITGTDTTNASLTHNTSVQLTVNPTLVSVSLNPTTVNGGTSSTGTVTLSGAATAGGAVVSLASSNSAVASVPSTVTVPAGATSANFTVSTSSVTTSTVVTITATYAGGQPQQANLTVNPAPTPSFTLTANPSSLTIARGSSGKATVTVNPVNGFNSSVTFSASNVPSRTNVKFNPNPSATSTTMTISVGPKASTGTYYITVSGSGGGVSASTTVTVTIQ